jgi:UDP-N-acetylmuramate--alanine ligase
MQKKHNFRIHFVGIKGVGMTSLAILAKEAGFTVSGSDTEESYLTENALEKIGIVPNKGFSESYVKGSQLVIYTAAHGGYNNPEVVTARANGIPIWSLGEAIGKFMAGTLLRQTPYYGISIAGTHGKTTTTSMIATILTKLKLDPSYIIGTSEVFSLPAPGHFGKGDYFIAEADEYVIDTILDHRPKFLLQRPKIAVITSIEHDHPDIYESLPQVIKAFENFVQSLPPQATLVVNGDDDRIRKVIQQTQANVRTYGFSQRNDYVITRIFVSGSQTFFWMKGLGVDFGEFHLQVPGEHNALNALASIIVASEIGRNIEETRAAILSYTGAKRRMEKVGSLPSGTLLYDDYAHHPTEITTTLKAFRAMFPRERIICIFQPHTFSRTQKMFDQFIRSFQLADTVFLMDIYGSAREKDTGEVSSLALATAMKRWHRDVIFSPSREDVVAALVGKHLREQDVVITMGAGDVYLVHELLLRALKTK